MRAFRQASVVAWGLVTAWAASLAAAPLPAVGPPGPRDAVGDPLPPGARARLGTTRLRHVLGTADLVFFPDGQRLASSGSDGFVYVWDTATGQELSRWQVAISGGVTLAFPPDADGKTLLTFNGRAPTEWDVTTGAKLREFRSRWGNVALTALTPDRRRMAVVTRDIGRDCEDLSVYELPSWKELYGPVPLERQPERVAIAPDGRRVAVEGDDDDRRNTWLQIWDVADGLALELQNQHARWLGDFRFSADGRTLVTRDKVTVALWDPETGREIDVLAHIIHSRP
jgi:WD40 repeat protein